MDGAGWYRSAVTDLHDDTAEDTAPSPPPTAVTRAAFGLTVVLLAVILVMAAQSEAVPTTPRNGRRVQLVELIRIEQART